MTTSVPTPVGEDARSRSVPWGGARARRAWTVWSVAALCYFTALFHRASLGVASDEALARFSAGPTLLSVFVALQLGVYLALQVPAGVLADRLGPRRVITGGMVALAVGSAVFGLGSSVLGGIAGRVLIGFGDAFMFTNVLRLAAHWFPGDRFGRVASLTGLVGGIGQLVATVPLSASLLGVGWVGTFVGAAAVTAAFAVLAWMGVRDRPEESEQPDDPSGVSRERVGETVRDVLARRGTRHAFWVHFVLMAQFVAVTTLWGPPWLTRAQGYGSAAAGTLVFVCVAAFLVGAWLSGRFVAGRPGRRDRYTTRLSWIVVATWLVIVAWPAAMPLGLLLGVLVVIGVGGGSAMLAFDGARAANPAHRSGTASGVVNMGGFAASVVILLAVGGVLGVAGSVPAVDAYRWAFVPVLVVLVLGSLGQVWQRDRARAAGPPG